MSLKTFDLRPLYLQVVDDFIGRIVSGVWPAGQFIASETEISRELGLSIGTVRRAFDILDQYGVLDRSQGKGTLILDASGEEASRRFVTFIDGAGERVAGELELIEASMSKADAAVAADLKIDPGSDILTMRRQRRYGERIFLTEIAQSPFVPPAGARGKAALMEAAEGRWFAHSLAVRMTETIKPIQADADDARSFGVPAGEALLELTRIIFSYDGTALERRVAHCYLGQDLFYENS
ncbi:GntR family transcriptional regulator [Aureimonas altamirensis]|uniref:GntR family transcriptional regulator n=1 Tax=Aureimonas altamirensis TaxID=370622 RepID=UPI002036D3AD|nr:GntR family transcriptional regulator [Aureimonas altamirensis]MCM2504149.1 GntR family transcriptional regulator [Aureimonas altamirensis]